MPCPPHLIEVELLQSLQYGLGRTFERLDVIRVPPPEAAELVREGIGRLLWSEDAPRIRPHLKATHV